MSANADKIRGFADLTPGWNTYDDLIFTPLCIERGLLVLAAFEEAGLPPDRVAPSVNNEVSLMWFGDNKLESYVWLPIDEDGDAFLVLVGPVERGALIEDVDIDNLGVAIERARAYLEEHRG